MNILIVLIAAFSVSPAYAAESSVNVFKPRGSVQCEPESGIAPDIMRKNLEKAGIPVQSASCGIDGLMHISACGAEDGTINIFQISPRKAEKALALGFQNLDDLPDAQVIPCR